MGGCVSCISSSGSPWNIEGGYWTTTMDFVFLLKKGQQWGFLHTLYLPGDSCYKPHEKISMITVLRALGSYQVVYPAVGFTRSTTLIIFLLLDHLSLPTTIEIKNCSFTSSLTLLLHIFGMDDSWLKCLGNILFYHPFFLSNHTTDTIGHLNSDTQMVLMTRKTKNSWLNLKQFKLILWQQWKWEYCKG